MAKLKNTYPDWAEKFRGKGKTIRKVKNGYGLYECTSEYVKGEKYPKSRQKYLGMITEKGGFIPKKSDAPNPDYIEYALSNLIHSNFRRDVQRHVFDFSEEMFKLGIIDFIFGDTSEAYLLSSRLTYGEADRLSEIRDKVKTEKINRISQLIETGIERRIPDRSERDLVRKLLMLCVTEAAPGAKKPHIPDAVADILKNHGLKYDEE